MEVSTRGLLVALGLAAFSGFILAAVLELVRDVVKALSEFWTELRGR